MKNFLSSLSFNVAPPMWAIFLFLFLGVSLVGGIFMVSGPPSVRDPNTFRVAAFYIGASACAYALYRLNRFHPVHNKSYMTWLRLSPWTPDKPLPLGPVYLVWQDAVVVGLLCICGSLVEGGWKVPLIAFILTYLIGFTFSLLATRTWGYGAALGFIWPTALLSDHWGWTQIGTLAGLVLVLWLGHRKSLQTFPWKTCDIGGKPVLLENIPVRLHNQTPDALVKTAGEQRQLGWPYSELTSKMPPPVVPKVNGFFISALLGWWAYCCLKQVAFSNTDLDLSVLPGFIYALAFFLAVYRLCFYLAGIAPPSSIFCRPWHGEFIVPKFDQIILVPLIVVAIGLVGGSVLKLSELFWAAKTAFLVFLIWWIVLNSGPTSRAWRLSGKMRFVPPARQKASMRGLKAV